VESAFDQPAAHVRLGRNRDFVLMQAGQLLSSAGSSFTSVAYPLLVLSLTHSPAKAGLVSFARLVPSPLLGLLAGAAADRWDRRRVMLAADAVRALAIGTLAIVVAVRPAYWAIAAVAFVEGAGDPFFFACQSGAIRNVVPAEQLPAAIGVQQSRAATVGIAGPPIGGALFGVARALPFVVDAASYTFSFLSLLAMRTPFQQARERSPLRLRAQLAEGFRFLWAEPFLRATTLLYAVGNFTIPATLFVLVVAAREHGYSAGLIGVLLAVFSGFLLLGSLLAAFLRRRLGARAIILAELYAGLATVAFLARPSPLVLAAAILPQAIVLPVTDTVVVSRRLTITPDHLLGRVEAVRATIARTALPLGPLVAGVLISAASARAAIAVLATVGAALAVWGTTSRALGEPAPAG
jgi:MFS family permease